MSLGACSVEPVPIQYGQDACDFCKMNIVDNQHAAELVTSKGRAFKYDAIECMVGDVEKHEEIGISFLLITDYSSPGELVDAKQATYLVSEAIPSPMGANLTGFADKQTAKRIQQEKGGQLFSWEELPANIKQVY